MTSLSQSVAHFTFSHSQIYTSSFQPTIELLLKSIKKPPPTTSSETKSLKSPLPTFQEPLVVFDPDIRKVRKTSPKDGIFYYLCTRPSVLHEARNREYLRPKKLRLLICVTIGSHTRDEYENTIFGIYQNLKTFKDIGICNEDIAVIAIIDGCLKMDQSLKDLFRQEDKAKGFNEKKSLHYRSKIFESPHRYPECGEYPRDSIYMYQMSVKPQVIDKSSKDNYLNVFLCTKLESTGILGSHLWFFKGFCEMFNPEYCCLLEAGTKPNGNALYEFFKTMEVDRQIGAVCGYISLFTEPTVDEFGSRIDEDSNKQIDMLSKFSFQFFDLQKSQVFEYAFDHIIDKSFESFFGFSHSLPSVFSAYRWDALKGDSKKNLMDDVYLRSLLDLEFVFSDKITLEQANMHLAEDRILSLEIFSRKNYLVKYVPDAIAWTSASQHLVKLMDHRRIKINSSWFAMHYLTGVCWDKVLESEHSWFRLVGFYILMAYSTIGLILFYFSVSFYCIILHLVSTEFFSNFFYVNSDNTYMASASGTIMFIYLLLVGSLLFCSLIYKSKEGVGQFQMATTGLGFFNLFCVGYFIYLVINILILQSSEILNKSVVYTDEIDRSWDFKNVLAISNILFLQIIGIVAAGSYIIPMILNPVKSLLDIIFSFKDYIFYLPMYNHTLLIYAFCNIDDLSGGTKVFKGNTDLMKKSNKFKIQYVYRWLSLNMLVTYIMMIVNTDPIYKNYFILVVSLIFTGNLAFKSLFAIINHLKYYLYEKHYYNYKIKEKFIEYKTRSTDLMKFIEKIKQTISQQQNAMNFSAVSMNYEDNTRNNRYVQSEKEKIQENNNYGNISRLEKSKLVMVMEEEDSKGENSNHSSPNNAENIFYNVDGKNNKEQAQDNKKYMPGSPKKSPKKSMFNEKYNNSGGTNTKKLKEEAQLKLHSSGKFNLLEEQNKMSENEIIESINLDMRNVGKNLDVAFDDQKKNKI